MARKVFDWKRMAERYQFLPHYFSRPPKWRLWLRSLRGPWIGVAAGPAIPVSG